MFENAWLNRTVWGMAFTSFLSDLGQEAPLGPDRWRSAGVPPCMAGHRSWAPPQ